MPGSSILSIVSMYLTAALCLLPVIVLLFLLKLRYGAELKHALAGLLAYLVFPLCLSVFLQSLLRSQLESSPAFSVVYAVLAVAVLEQGGRYLYFRFMRPRWQQGLATPLMFSAGYCSVEWFAVGLNALMGALLMGRLLGAGGAEALTELTAAAAEAKEQLMELERVMGEESVFFFLVGGLERLWMLVFQMSASMLVYPAATGRGPLWLLPLALILNACANLPAALSNAGYLSSSALAIMLIFLAASLSAAAAYLVWRKYGDYGLRKAAPRSDVRYAPRLR